MIDDLKFSSNSPIMIRRNGEIKNIFAPLKSSSCDISIVSNKILTDLYSTDKKEVKVKIEYVDGKNNPQKTLFEGYMTPNTFSRAILPNLDNIDMTTIDPISMLKYLYIDDIIEKSKTITIGELIGKSLAAVKMDVNELLIETTIGYKGGYSLVDFKIQTNNFWDEGDEASTLYNAVSEVLRLFGYSLAFTGDRYIIYTVMTDHNFMTRRNFNRYIIEDGGILTPNSTVSFDMEKFQFKEPDGDYSPVNKNNDFSIGDVYEQIEATASTKVPKYSETAFDLVKSDEKEKYNVGQLNIQCNKIHGYNEDYEKIEDDEWYYLWNGVYVSDKYGLNITNGSVSGYINMNGTYLYETGQSGYPSATGGVLNFYGGETNPIATSKTQQEERSVEIKECITVFAVDNGTPPELLDRSDLGWKYKQPLPANSEEFQSPTITKEGNTERKFGKNINTNIDKVSYSQKYTNIVLSEDTEQTLVIDLTQSYSRIGINENIPIVNYSDIDNKLFYGSVTTNSSNLEIYDTLLIEGVIYTYPKEWASEEVCVNNRYFSRYASGDKMLPVFDKRKIIIYCQLSDGRFMQFNGKEWIVVEEVGNDNAFYFKKLMNDEMIFNDDFRYDLIETFDGDTYSLNEDGFTFRTDSDGYIVESKGDMTTYEYYGKTGNEWMKYIDEISEGMFKLILPRIDDINTNVFCNIYNSSLLGKTGNTSHNLTKTIKMDVKYKKEVGRVQKQSDNTIVDLASKIDGIEVANYGAVIPVDIDIRWLPVNATYVKAEHLDLNVYLTVAESNLGKIFRESDIKYKTNVNKKFREIYEAPSFLVNTKHNIAKQSHSYIIIDKSIADPNDFTIITTAGYNKLTQLLCRPENYVLQGYKNYYSVIRRIVNKSLTVKNKREFFGNVMCYVEDAELQDMGNGKWVMVVVDNWDVKTNRHTITAVEDYGITVEKINNYVVIEVPRKARNELFNLPNAVPNNHK
jgi:hypothetical protein